MNNKTPFISVIIPTLNASQTLAKALGSLKKQSFKNFEVLIMDAKSKDKTLKIAEDYQNSLSRLRIYSEEDEGIYDAMNKGIKKSDGIWIYFLGGDDYLFDNLVLEKVVQKIEKNDCDVLYGNVFSNFYKGIYDGIFSYEKLAIKNICHQAVFLKKNVFKTTGLFNLKYKVASDWDHNIKWFFNDKIRHKYIDLVIANFTDGGYSYIHSDETFNNAKSHILLKVGLNKLSFHTLKKFCKTEIALAREKNMFFKKMFFKTCLIFIKGRNKIRKKVSNKINLC